MSKAEKDGGAHVVWIRGLTGPQIQIVFGAISPSTEAVKIASVPLTEADVALARAGDLSLDDVAAVYTPQSVRDLQDGGQGL